LLTTSANVVYPLSSGPGSLELSPAAGAEPGFFVMVFRGLSYPARWYTEGLKVMTTTYPIKPPLCAITKATNNLSNVLMQMEAKAAGLDNGVFIDELGFVSESSNMNVAFVMHDGVLRHPKCERVLPGCTSLRVLELAQHLVGRGVLTGVEVCDLPAGDARHARETVLLGSSVKVAPIVAWDGRPIGDGRPGPAAAALLALIEEDMRSGDRLIDVPY
jgi:4-amino-4-deoxychorismate lyase